MLIVERGIRITRVQPRNQQDDIYTMTQGLWQTRPGLVRIVHRPVEDADITALGELTRSEALGEAVLIEGAPGDGSSLSDPAVHLVRADELVTRIRASALIEWQNGVPRPAQGRFDLAKDLGTLAPALDPVGLRWLPTLALNQVPPELEGSGTADDLLERISFRILTTALRFGGRRLGARKRGQRVPDSILRWSANAALLDCKAAQYGYRMDINDQRALTEYFRSLKGAEAEAGFSLSHVVVISGEFAGALGERHPYYQRAEGIREECGAKLVYLRASDIVRLVIEIESAEAEPAVREGINWAQVFDHGMPAATEMIATWEESR